MSLPCHMMLLLLLLAAASCLALHGNEEDGRRNHKKRQIYREQVLPHTGGRIPDTAFETDRLLLNRLQKEGISIPDGIVLEQRNPQVYPFTAKSARNVYRVALTPDERYTPDAGKYYHRRGPSIETTYLLPAAVYGPNSGLVHPRPSPPVYRQFQLANNQQLNPKRFQAKVKGMPPLQSASKLFKSESYQNINIVNVLPQTRAAILAGSKPVVRAAVADVPIVEFSKRHNDVADCRDNFYIPQYGKPNICNEFDTLFESFYRSEDSGNMRTAHLHTF